jgi:hypothetical protein
VNGFFLPIFFEESVLLSLRFCGFEIVSPDLLELVPSKSDIVDLLERLVFFFGAVEALLLGCSDELVKAWLSGVTLCFPFSRIVTKLVLARGFFSGVFEEAFLLTLRFGGFEVTSSGLLELVPFSVSDTVASLVRFVFFFGAVETLLLGCSDEMIAPLWGVALVSPVSSCTVSKMVLLVRFMGGFFFEEVCRLTLRFGGFEAASPGLLEFEPSVSGTVASLVRFGFFFGAEALLLGCFDELKASLWGMELVSPALCTFAKLVLVRFLIGFFRFSEALLLALLLGAPEVLLSALTVVSPV